MSKITIILALLLICGCSIEAGAGRFRSSNQEYMAHLINELDKNNVIYTIDSEGYIYYEASQREVFLRAEKRIDHIINEGISFKLDDDDEIEFMVSLLKNNNLEHYLLEKDDGIWVKWYPDSKEHQLEIMKQLVEYGFSKKLKSKGDCVNAIDKKASNNSLNMTGANNAPPC